jgi:hypothetical protein
MKPPLTRAKDGDGDAAADADDDDGDDDDELRSRSTAAKYCDGVLYRAMKPVS